MTNSLIVPRLFTEFNQPKDRENPPLPLTSFSDRSALVVLGDPGSGKTTSFEQAAKEEPNGEFVTLRRFLRTNDPDRFCDRVLFIDALDEVRARTQDGATVLDDLIGRLEELDRPKFRLSCRASDWYGGLDERNLADAAADGRVTVVQLEPLDEAGIRTIVRDHGADPADFVQQAKQHGVFELLTNPQGLELMLEVVGGGEDWPRTKTELFKRACLKLVEEPNLEHGRSPRGQLDREALLGAAGYLCAIHLCAGSAGFALTRPAADDAFPCIQDLQYDLELLKAGARRKLFHAEGPERVMPVHRTVAEYLAARYLTKRVYEGLPIGRILALITGFDGGTLSDLRGLFAWLACRCFEHAETLIARDPLGVVLYGDVAPLPLSTKRAVLKGLARLTDQDSWFRSENRSAQPFGALAADELLPDFRAILDDRSQHPVLVKCVLDAIAHGQALPALGDLLLEMVRDESRQEVLRLAALEAFKNTCPHRPEELVQLLEDVHAGRIPDADRHLRGKLLSSLYPQVIGPTQIMLYLVEDSPDFIGEYSIFLMYRLVDTTDPGDLPILLDTLAISELPSIQADRRSDRFRLGRLIGRLLAKTLNFHGETAPAERVYRWLGIALDEYDHSIVDAEEAKALRAYFELHP